MKVSGFTFIRNAIIYDYPVVESIKSILPLCDEFIVAVGNSEDQTRLLIESISDSKIKIIDTIIQKCNFPILYANNLETFIEIYQYYQDKIRITWIDDECLELLKQKKLFRSDLIMRQVIDLRDALLPFIQYRHHCFSF